MGKVFLRIFDRNRDVLMNNGRRNLVKFLMLNKIIFLGFDWLARNVKGWRKKELLAVIFGCIVSEKLFFMFVQFLGWNPTNGLDLNLSFFLFHPSSSFFVGLARRLLWFFNALFVIDNGKIIVFRLRKGGLLVLRS